MLFSLFKAPAKQEVNFALSRLEKIILETLDFKKVIQRVVDSMLYELGYLKLGYRIIVLALINEEKQVLERVSISQTPEAEKAIAGLPFPFNRVEIPLDAKANFSIRVMEEKKPLVTHSWSDILNPPLRVDQAILLQKHVGIRTSMLYPLLVQNKAIGMMIFSMVKDESEVSQVERDLLQRFTDIVGLAVQNSKLYSSLEEKTEQIRTVNEQFKVANIKLQELDKLKDEFVSLASHELRTPMTAIKGSLSTILEGYTGQITPEAREFLSAAYNENDRLIRLVNNLLNISRIEAGRFTFTVNKVSIEELIIEVVHNLQTAAKEKTLTLKYEKTVELPMVLADTDKVKEVIINLIGNAIKFTHKGGITLKAQLNDGMVVVSVSDTGSGIAKEDQDLLFKKFSQVRGSYAKQAGGTGLGLYISKQIIEGLNGKVWLESTLGQGSTFYFSLPVAT